MAVWVALGRAGNQAQGQPEGRWLEVMTLTLYQGGGALAHPN